MIPDSTTFRAVVSGARRSLDAAVLRALLQAAEVPYAAAMRFRNWRYDTGRAAIEHIDVPVVSVGNLTLGGTGKTPLVEWIARWFRTRDVRVALVSRGYGAEQGALNDEARELEQKLPDVPHVQNRDRVEAARTAIEEFASQAILLDDGFQHRRLARDLDIVLIDASEPFGYRHVFPRGLLREPLAGLRRADVVILSRSDMIGEADRLRIRAEVHRHAPDATWAEVAHVPKQLVSANGDEWGLKWLKGQRIAAFCGLGNPSGFRHTLEHSGCELAGFRTFPDHHQYGRNDVESIIAWAEKLDVASLVCTHKDLVKLGSQQLGRKPLWALVVAIEFRVGQSEVEKHLETMLPPSDPPEDAAAQEN